MSWTNSYFSHLTLFIFLLTIEKLLFLFANWCKLNFTYKKVSFEWKIFVFFNKERKPCSRVCRAFPNVYSVLKNISQSLRVFITVLSFFSLFVLWLLIIDLYTWNWLIMLVRIDGNMCTCICLKKIKINYWIVNWHLKILLLLLEGKVLEENWV